MMLSGSPPTIVIDMNLRCKGCGRRGATRSGYCLRCVAKRIKKLPPKGEVRNDP